MSEQGMTRLEADVRAMVLGAGGDPGPIKTVFAANLRTTPFSLFSAWDKLARLGAEDRHRIPADVEWARDLVNEVLQALGMGSDGRWRNLLPVARGIVDLIAGEIQSYRRQREGSTGSMTGRVLVVTLGLLALATSAWSQVPPHLADSWAKCQEQVHARFGSGAAISFGPATPRLDTARGVGYLFGVVQGRSSQRFTCEMKTEAFRVIRVIVEE
jgi:hypothetical protein